MEIQPQDYNIWAGSQTRNGFAADEIMLMNCMYLALFSLKSSGADFLQSLLKTLALEI